VQLPQYFLILEISVKQRHVSEQFVTFSAIGSNRDCGANVARFNEFEYHLSVSGSKINYRSAWQHVTSKNIFFRNFLMRPL